MLGLVTTVKEKKEHLRGDLLASGEEHERAGPPPEHELPAALALL